MSRIRLSKFDAHWASTACASMYKDVKFLPYRKITQGEFEIWFRQSENEDDEDFHVAQVWHGDDGMYHIAGQYNEIFSSLEEAQNSLDRFIVESGGMIVPDKLVSFL